MTRENVIGQQYGRQLIVDDAPSQSNRMVLCECQCDKKLEKQFIYVI